MKTILQDERQAEGRIVERVEAFGSHLAILFTNDAALVYEAEGDEDGPEIYLMAKPPDAVTCRYLGLVTPEEYNTAREQETAAREAAADLQERAIYEKLRAKFEQPPSAGAVDPHASSTGKLSPRE